MRLNALTDVLFVHGKSCSGYDLLIGYCLIPQNKCYFVESIRYLDILINSMDGHSFFFNFDVTDSHHSS